MHFDHNNSTANIYRNITENSSSHPITLILGQFGIGKSEIVREIFADFCDSTYFDCLLNINFGVEKQYISNYLKSTEIHFPKSDISSFNSDIHETSYNDNRLSELLKLIKENDFELADHVVNKLKLKLFVDLEENDKHQKSEFNRKIEELLEKKGDRRLIVENFRVTAESLIVDLMNIFFPNTEKFSSFDKYLDSITSPVKVLFVFDNFDRISFSIYNWLSEYFLPLCLHAKLGDFIAFNVRESEKELYVNQFFNFHFIISNRIDPSINDFFPFFSKNADIIQKYELKPFNHEESISYLQSEDAEKKLNHDEIITSSFGNQFLMDIFIQSDTGGINTESDKVSIYGKIASKYLDGKTSLQSDSIKLASLLDSFTEFDLRTMPILFDKSNYSWRFLLFLNDITEFKGLNLAFKYPFNIIFQSAYSEIYHQEILESKNVGKILESINELLPNLSDDDLRIARSLAYFENFDYDIAIESAFLEKSEDAKIFVQKHSHFFFKHLHTYSLKGDLRNILMKLNNIIDKNKIEAKNNLVKSIWDKRLKEITEEKNNIEIKLINLQQEADEFSGDPTKGKNYYEEQQRKFIKAENDLIHLRKNLGDFSSSRFLINLIINSLATVLSFLTSYFFPDIFSTPENHSSIIIIQYILYFITLVFGFLSIHNAYKIINIRMQKEEIRSIQEKISSLELEKSSYQEEMKLFKDSKSSWQKRSQEIIEQIKTNKYRLDSLDSIIKEPYI